MRARRATSREALFETAMNGREELARLRHDRHPLGADGIHSVVQREISLKTYPSSQGIMAYRGLNPAAKCQCGSGKAAVSCGFRCRAAA